MNILAISVTPNFTNILPIPYIQLIICAKLLHGCGVPQFSIRIVYKDDERIFASTNSANGIDVITLRSTIKDYSSFTIDFQVSARCRQTMVLIQPCRQAFVASVLRNMELIRFSILRNWNCWSFRLLGNLRRRSISLLLGCKRFRLRVYKPFDFGSLLIREFRCRRRVIRY